MSESPGKSVASPKKAKGKTVGKSAAPASSPARESLVGPAITVKAGSAVSVEEESAVPVPPGTMYNRTRSKRKATAERAKSKVNAYPFLFSLLLPSGHFLMSCAYPFLSIFFF